MQPLVLFVMAGLDPAIHEKPARPPWMPGSSPGMTKHRIEFMDSLTRLKRAP